MEITSDGKVIWRHDLRLTVLTEEQKKAAISDKAPEASAEQY